MAPGYVGGVTAGGTARGPRVRQRVAAKALTAAAIRSGASSGPKWPSLPEDLEAAVGERLGDGRGEQARSEALVAAGHHDGAADLAEAARRRRGAPAWRKVAASSCGRQARCTDPSPRDSGTKPWRT